MDEYLAQERKIPAMKVRKPDLAEHRISPSEANQSTRPFEDLFLEHWNSINRLLQQITGDPAEAEDLALETFIKYHQHPPKTGEGYNPGGWLYRVATNLGLHSIRSFKRREHYELAAGTGSWEAAQEGRPAEILESKEDHQITRLALAEMNPRRAELLVLRYSGMSYRNIASAMNLSPTSIGPLLLRAEREFEKAYRALNQEEV
jgi:RNA polymerase sigma factor (sigma-70 family)